MSEVLIDLHCHILPGIDDGARNLETTRALLRKELDDGVVGIVFTPHFHMERTTVDAFAERRKRAFRQTVELMQAEQMRLAAKLGSEIYYSAALPGLELEKLAIADTNYLLIELPTSFHPGGIEDTLFAIQQQGFQPILAHVERYPYVTEDPTLLYQWVSAGALAQINAGPLIHGQRSKKILEKYIEWNLVHFIGTDAHSMDHRAPNLRDGLAALPAAEARRFQKNAYHAFLGEELRPEEPHLPVYRLGRWW